MIEDVDIVYTWVDGLAPEMVNKRNDFARKTGNTEYIKQVCRYKDNQELKYSLRSIEKNIPWVRKIFIITDEQIPSWLDTGNERVRIVDLTEIFPDGALPCFNSNAIEHCIYRIDGLAEHFIYSCDDMFVARPVDKSFFFNEKGYPICRYERPYKKSENVDRYTQYLINAADLIESKFNVCYSYWPHHNMDSYTKSEILACRELFKKELDETIYHHFRALSDIQRNIYSLYSCAVGHGDYKILGANDSNMNFWEKLGTKLHRNQDYDSWQYSLSEHDRVQEIMQQFNPKLICINDDESSEDKDRNVLQDLLETLFPEKSSFER